MNVDNVWTEKSSDHNRLVGQKLRPAPDLVEYFREYTRERPGVVALWCFGIGFVLGWKLKPW